jgi:hypothetical protein
MIKKKKIVGIAVTSVMAVSLCLGATSVLAANNDALKKNATEQGAKLKVQTVKKDYVERVRTHDDRVAIAKEIGINVDGMTDEQIDAAIGAYKQSHQDKSQPDGLPLHEHLIAVTKEVGIYVDGMTDEQMEAALTAYKLSHQSQEAKPLDIQAIAKKMSIDTTGMSNDQIKSAISEKGKVTEVKK